MSQVEWQKVKEIFYTALTSAPEQRSDYLDSACGNDGPLRSEVEVLLASYESQYLEDPLLDAAVQPEVEQTPLFEPGRTFTHYEILKLLGRGGMGEVYLANDTALDRLTAIKVIHRNSGFGDQAAARLIREARSAAKLDHPNICSIYEVGEADGQPFIAMQYIEGEMLDALIKRGSLTLDSSIAITRQIAAALMKAHSWGIVHRDIKPSNIIIDIHDQAKVLDFGLAKETEGAADDLGLSVAGQIAGTVTYMSPEHVRGHEISPQTDVWSLGVVFYQMLTGRLPFRGETRADLIAAILTRDPEPLTPGAAVSPVEQIIARALDKDLATRYGSIEEMDADLARLAENALADLSFERPAALANVTPSPAKRSLRRFAVPVIVFLLLAAGGAGLWRTQYGGGVVAQPFADAAGMQISTLFSLKRQTNGAITSLAFSPGGEAVAFALTGGELHEGIFLQQLAGGQPVLLTDEGSIAGSPVWSADGERIAYLSSNGGKPDIWSMSRSGEDSRQIAGLERSSGTVNLVKWSNDGQRIFFLDNDGPHMIDLLTNQVSAIDLTGIEGSITRGFVVSPDESRFFAVSLMSGDERLWVKSMNAADARRISEPFTRVGMPSWFPDNRTYAYSSDQTGTSQIYIRDIDDSPPRAITFGNTFSTYPHVSSDGHKIVYVSNIDEANLYTVDVSSGKETSITSDIHMQLFPAFSPDGRRIAYQSVNDGSRLGAGSLKIASPSDSGPGRSVDLDRHGSKVSWAPNGEAIAFLRREGRTSNIIKMDAIDSRETPLSTVGVSGVPLTIAPYDYEAPPFQWSPDSSAVAFAARTSGLSNIWTVASDGSNERMVTDMRDPDQMLGFPMWSPDGKRLAFLQWAKSNSSSGGREIKIVTHAYGGQISVAEFPVPCTLLGWSKKRDGVFVAVSVDGKPVDGSRDIYFVSADGPGKVQKLSRLPNARKYGIRISPDEKWIAFADRREGVDDLYVLPLEGGMARRVTSNNDENLFYSGLVWASDSKTLLYSKQTGGMQISLITHIKQEDK